MRLILGRFAQMLFVLWVVATLLFFMFRLMPGDPSAAYIDSTFTEEQIAQLRRTFGLDRPLHEQYAIYLQNLLIGEFGESFHQRRPVLEILAGVLANTASSTMPSQNSGAARSVSTPGIATASIQVPRLKASQAPVRVPNP